MATNRKIPKRPKELVIPFDGEHDFIVPKHKGFGQPDNDYLMVIGTQLNVDTAPSSTGITTSSPSISGSGSANPTSQTYSSGGGAIIGNAGTLTTTQHPSSTGTITSGEPTSGGIETAQTTLQTESGTPIHPSLTLTPAPSTNTFPSDNPINIPLPFTRRYPLPNRLPPIIVPTPVLPIPPISGGGGGMGGGGGGGSTDEQPADAGQTTESGGINWLLIAAIIGGILLLSRKGHKVIIKN